MGILVALFESYPPDNKALKAAVLSNNGGS